MDQLQQCRKEARAQIIFLVRRAAIIAIKSEKLRFLCGNKVSDNKRARTTKKKHYLSSIRSRLVFFFVRLPGRELVVAQVRQCMHLSHPKPRLWCCEPSDIASSFALLFGFPRCAPNRAAERRAPKKAPCDNAPEFLPLFPSRRWRRQRLAERCAERLSGSFMKNFIRT